MATSARRVGLFSRSGRRYSRETDSQPEGITLSRARSWSRPDDDNTGQQLNEGTTRKGNTNTDQMNQVNGLNNGRIKRKTSAYSRPDGTDKDKSKKALNFAASKRTGFLLWKDFFSRNPEAFLIGTLLILIITISLYIVFVEGQSLIGKEK